MNRSVLLIEDLENDIFFITRSWTKENVQVPLRSVMDGHQALAYLSGDGEFADRQKNPPPCLILLDLKLPWLKGLDVLAWIRSQPEWKTVPVLVLTSSALQSDIDEAYKLGANAFLVKPPGIYELAELVRLIRDFWLGANQFPGSSQPTLPRQQPAPSHGSHN